MSFFSWVQQNVEAIRQRSTSLLMTRSTPAKARDRFKQLHRKIARGFSIANDSSTQRLEDVDGGFFESFTALSWKQENRRLQLVKEDEEESEKENTFSPDARSGMTMANFKFTQQQMDELYGRVIYTIRHRIQTPDEFHDENSLMHFVNQIFDPSADLRNRSLVRADESKPPQLIVNVTVIEAHALEAKDPNGFSDPYCMLGIQPGNTNHDSSIPTIIEPEAEGSEEEKHDKPKRSHGFRLSFKRKDRGSSSGGGGNGDHKEKEKSHLQPELLANAIPAKIISATSVQPATLNPKWEEKFQFDVDDVNSDKLHLDIWDHDDESSVLEAVKKLNEISTWKGLGRYFKQIAQSARTGDGDNVDDFLGSVTISLNSIPSLGVEEWFQLAGRSHRSNIQGKIKLKLTWTTHNNKSNSFEQHQHLWRIFVDHQHRNDRNWEGHLSTQAQTLLQQDALLNNISHVHQVACKWITLSRKYMELALDFSVLLTTLSELNEAWTPDTTLSSREEEMLSESFTLFVDFSLNLIRKQRDLFPATNKSALNRLESILRCLALLQSMSIFWLCCPFHKELPLQVAHVIKKGTAEWYDKTGAFSKPQTATEDSVTRSFIDLTNTVNTDVQRAYLFYNKIYKDCLNLPYFDLVYKQLDRLLTNSIGKQLNLKINDDLSSRVQELCLNLRKLDVNVDIDEMSEQDIDIGTHMFELYMALQEFYRFKLNLPASDQEDLNIENYPQWFAEAVNRWLLIARYKAMLRIKRAVELEKVVSQVESLVKHSTSAVDVTSCFYQIKIFWRQLAWPDRVSSFVFVAKILDDISSGATYYVHLMFNKVLESGFFDDEGQFDVTEQLCVAINNMEHVRQSLLPLRQELEFDAVADALERNQGEAAGKQCRTALNNVLNSATEDVENQIIKVIEQLGQRMRPFIRKFAFHLTWAPETLPADEAIVPLMEYLDSNLTTLNGSLLTENFERVLIVIWNVVMEEVFTQAESEVGEKQLLFFDRLHSALNILFDFFHAEEKGLSVEKLHSAQFQKCEQLLNLNRMDTSELIVQYYLDKLEQQQKAVSSEFGVLSVRVYFHHDSLSVEIISAKDILALDTNGFSDPFVILEILPQNLFPNCPVQRTRVQKRTLQPVFDEIFEYSVTLNQCQHVSSMIQFTVMDHDILLSNDFAGEAFLSLNRVPGVDKMTEDISTHHGLKPIELNLLRPKQSENEILKALEKRTWDKTAQEFVKKRKAHSA